MKKWARTNWFRFYYFFFYIFFFLRIPSCVSLFSVAGLPTFREPIVLFWTISVCFLTNHCASDPKNCVFIAFLHDNKIWFWQNLLLKIFRMSNFSTFFSSKFEIWLLMLQLKCLKYIFLLCQFYTITLPVLFRPTLKNWPWAMPVGSPGSFVCFQLFCWGKKKRKKEQRIFK